MENCLNINNIREPGEVSSSALTQYIYKDKYLIKNSFL